MNMASIRGFGKRYCLKCQSIVGQCPCTHIYQGLYHLKPGLHTELDIDETEAVPAGDDLQDIDHHARNDLDVTAPLCPKSSQHKDFIATDAFSIDHLPPRLWHPTFYVWLRNCIPSVVRVIARSGRLASGRATLIPNEIGIEMDCTDTNCPHRRFGPHVVYGGMGVITNKHVVQNEEDAHGTVVEFFYTDYDTRHFTVKKEKGHAIYLTNNSMDYTMFSCYIHDKDLLTIIATCDKIRNTTWRAIPEHIRTSAKEYAIIISHPHGTPKKVSIGHVIGQEKQDTDSVDHQENATILKTIYNICEENNGLLRFAAYFQQVPDIELVYAVTWYTTATCKGSSGAPVFMGNVVWDDGEINQAHTHRGVDTSNGYNHCYT